MPAMTSARVVTDEGGQPMYVLARGAPDRDGTEGPDE